MKNGEGKYLYLDRGQVYTGTWVDDVAKCGTVEDVDGDSAPNPPPYPIPQVYIIYMYINTHFQPFFLQCTLEDPDAVLSDAREELAQ